MNKKRKVMSVLKMDRNEILLKMKLLTLLLFAAFVSASANSYSQATKFNLNMKDASISDVFQKIEEQSEFIILFNEKTLNVNRKVNVMVKGQTVDKILDQIFEVGKDAYKIFDRQIVIQDEEPSQTSSANGAAVSSLDLAMNVQQPKIVKGKVVDDTGTTLPGVSIVVVGSTRGVTTDNDGSFSINVAPADKLFFSFIGMESRTIEVLNLAEIIVLKTMHNELDDVTIVAFGKQKKESVVSSITTINAKELKVPSSNLTTAFAGRMAGIISYQRSGEPGKDEAEFFVRGVTTFGTGKANPLILIDGVEMSSTDLSHLTADDIGSFSIMKDANATALYGARGANGVILVNTKEGTEGKTKLSFRMETSLSSPTDMVDIADPMTFMKLRNEAVHARDPLANLPYTSERINITEKGTEPLLYPKVDWYDMLFNKNTINDRYNLNINGGGKMARYYVAAAYSKDRGILKDDINNNFRNNINVKRYSLRSNINMKFTPTTDAVIRLNADLDKTTGPLGSGADYFDQARNASPVDFPAYYPKDPIDQNTFYANHILFGSDPLMKLVNPYANMVKGYKESSSSTMLAQVELSQKLDFITQGLSARALFNLNRYSYYDFSRSTTPFLYSMSKNTLTGNNVLTNRNPKEGKAYLVYNNGADNVSSSMYSENVLQYSRKFADKHDVSGILVFTLRNFQNGNASDLITSLPYRNLTYAGRFTYGYDTRYFLEANFGYWGSERFAKNERWGFFPSAGVGWMVSNEKFMEPIKNTITKLKLKATYGLTGNDQIGSSNDRFFYMSNVTMQDATKASQFGTSLSYSLPGVTIQRYADPNITWEISQKSNFGIELGLVNDLEIQMDYFREFRKNILQYRSDIPSTMGLQSIPSANLGQAKSHGFEASIDYNHSFDKDFWIGLRGNFTYAKSKYARIEEPDYISGGTPWLSHVGQSLSQPFGMVAERLFIDAEDVSNSPEQTFGNYMAGDIKYKDINGDGKISSLDVVPIGLPTTPEIIYGFGFSVGYKKFDLSCFFQGSANSSFFIDPKATAPFAGGTRAILKDYAEDHWTEENQNLHSLWPRLSPEVLNNNSVISSWWLRDGRFLRLKSAEFGYTLSNKFVKRLKLSTARFYFSGSNLFLLSAFKMWDVEMAGNGLGYPVQRVLNLGLKLDF